MIVHTFWTRRSIFIWPRTRPHSLPELVSYTIMIMCDARPHATDAPFADFIVDGGYTLP